MRKFEVSEYVVTTDKISMKCEGFNFAVISDLHSNVYKVNLEKVYESIVAAKVDAVLLVGDMFNGKADDDITEVMEFINRIAKEYQVFFALGNHEYRLAMNPDLYGDKIWQIIESLEEAGVAILSDETVVLEKGDDKIALTGLEIDSVFYGRKSPVMGSGLLKMHLGDADRDVFQLLMAHNPIYFKNYAAWGADLVLSGHVHGGIMRLFGKTPVISTDFKLFPKYSQGMYVEGNSTMLVSRGLGTHTIKIRIANKPELMIVKILAKQ